MPTTTVRPSPARRRLLRAATEIFYSEGIHDVGVDHILDRAAVTRSTFYRHFPSKEDLVLAYVQATDEEVRALLAEARSTSAGPEALLRAVARGLGDELCRPGFRGCAFINAAAEYPDPASPVRRAVLVHRDWLQGFVEAVLAELGHPAPASAARYFIVLRDGAMVAGYLHDPDQARETLERGIDALLTGAAPRFDSTP